MKLKLHLLTTLYPVRSKARLAELRHCITQNCRNPHIGTMHFFLEGFTDAVKASGDWDWLFAIGDAKLIYIDHRTNYADYFTYANEHLAGEMVLICNTDIFYDDSLRLVGKFPFPVFGMGSTIMLAITRYNWNPATQKAEIQGIEVGGNSGSQDTWIFKSPIRKFDWDITVGVLGCDSFLAQRAQEADIAVWNPAMNIISYHYHQDPERNDQPDGRSYWAHPEYCGVCVPFCNA